MYHPKNKNNVGGRFQKKLQEIYKFYFYRISIVLENKSRAEIDNVPRYLDQAYSGKNFHGFKKTAPREVLKTVPRPNVMKRFLIKPHTGYALVSLLVGYKFLCREKNVKLKLTMSQDILTRHT